MKRKNLKDRRRKEGKGERRKKRKKEGKRGQGWGIGGLEEVDEGERKREREIKRCGGK